MLLPLSKFLGEIPKLTSDNLPNGAAQVADNCDFAQGDLRGVRGPVLAGTTVGPGMYSDGTKSMGSPDRYLSAVKSSVIGDTHKRYYYSASSGGIRITTAASMGSGLNFTTPSTSYQAGVPAPDTSEDNAIFSVTAKQKDSVLSDFNWKVWAFYEKNGIQFQKQLIGNGTGDGEATVPAGYSFDVDTWTGVFEMPAIDSAQMPTEVVSELPKLTGQITGLIYEKESAAIGSLEAENTDNTSPTTTKTTTEEFAAATATALDGHTVSVNGKEYTKVSQWRDVNGGWHDLNQTVIDYNASLLTSSSLSGDGVTAQVLIEGYDNTRGGTKVVTIYSLGSALHTNNVTSRLIGGVDVSVEKAPDSEQSANKRKYKFKVHWGIAESRAYVFTYVNEFGEEGPPSIAYSVDLTYVQNAMLKLTRSPSSGGYAPVKNIRVYRANVASNGVAEYQFVTEVTLASVQVGTGYGDGFKSEQLGEVIPSWDRSRTNSEWSPPDADLTGLCMMQTNFAAAFRENEVHFSEPFRHWAWPVRYRVSVPNPIVTIMPHAGGLVVLTTAEPWFITGNHPDTLATQMVPLKQGCVARRAVVNRGDAVFYVSNDGIVSLVGMNGQIASEPLYTRDTWRQAYASAFGSMELAEHDGWLIAYSSSGAFTPIAVRMDEDRTGSQTELSMVAGVTQSCLTLPQTDGLYFSNGSSVYQFAGVSAQRTSWHWKSGYLVLPTAVSFACFEVRCSGSVTVSVYADDTLQRTVVVDGHEIFRLPSGLMSKRWHLDVTGAADAILHNINLATSMVELRGAV